MLGILLYETFELIYFITLGLGKGIYYLFKLIYGRSPDVEDKNDIEKLEYLEKKIKELELKLAIQHGIQTTSTQINNDNMREINNDNMREDDNNNKQIDDNTREINNDNMRENDDNNKQIDNNTRETAKSWYNFWG